MSGERTEEATPKRRSEARARGQVLKSVELNTAAGLLAGVALLQWALPDTGRTLAELTRHAIERAATTSLTSASLLASGLGLGLIVGRLVAPFLLGQAAVGVLVNLAQVGFLISGQALAPKFSRINPLEGAKRLLTFRSVFELLKALAKLAVIGGLAWTVLRDKSTSLSLLAYMGPAAVLATIYQEAMGLTWKIVGAVAIVALADYVYQRRQHESSLRMSLQEVKEEMKQSEGNPQLKARLRQRARALARQRMMQQVPKADVVVTNPTHFAVALMYGSGMEAPTVIAKGEGFIAQQIKRVARDHGVAVVENKPLAQALYKLCDVDQVVPPELYRAVADVLAFVYRLRPARTGALRPEGS